MNQRSGFVPINYRMAGSVVLVVGVLVLAALSIGWVTGWFVMTALALPLGIVLILIGLYLLWVARLR